MTTQIIETIGGKTRIELDDFVIYCTENRIQVYKKRLIGKKLIFDNKKLEEK